MIDLRSDTVTRPTPEMREAMARAEVGDDVAREDPTINELEECTADILGKEAAVYMPSGTMTNQVAIRSHTEPGDEVLLDADTHVYFYEAGAPAALSSVMCRMLPGIRGVFSAQAIEAAMRPRNLHFPPTKLVVVENTHNRGGGKIWPMAQITEVVEKARVHGLSLHLDGARLWNASAATGIPECNYARHFDSVSVCFSKGLGAPVGSILAGSRAFADRARRFRKQFGGGMRQAGIIAAGALYALKHHRERLVEDHENASLFARGVAVIPGIELNPTDVETNIITFKVVGVPAGELVQKLKGAGVLVNATGTDTIRAVTHLDVTRADIEEAVGIVRSAME